MEFNTIQGLRFKSKPEYAGKMFLTDFEEQKAKDVINEMEAAIKKLPLYHVMNGAFAQNAQAGKQILQAIADDNPELYLYGIKAVMLDDRYFVSDNNLENRVFQECLGGILADAINNNSERWLSVFKHMLQVWPHSKYWRVVNDVLCRAYALIETSDAECINIVAHGLLRDPFSWRAAFDAMMNRAISNPGETTAQFSEVFSFLDIYGQSATGKDGISIPQNIYSRRDSAMQQAFEAQSDEMKQELREIGAITLGGNKQIRHYLSKMFGINRTGEDLGDIEALFKSDPDAAKSKLCDRFDVRNIIGWEKLHSPELIFWMGEKMADAHYSIAEKQILGYRLSVFRKYNRQKSEASEAARRILYDYHPTDDSDQECVLAGCFKMLAVASDPKYSINSNSIIQEMIELLIRHSNMEVNQRSMLDRKDRGAIWRNMISNYDLSPVIRASLTSIIQETDLANPEAVRRMFKIIADTFSPLELNNPQVLRDAVPHEDLKRILNQFLALNTTTMRFEADYDFLHETLPKILDALEAISIQEIYNEHYGEIVGHFHIYCRTLDDNRLRRIRDSYGRIMGLIRQFPEIAGG